jgi:hypothetical protein
MENEKQKSIWKKSWKVPRAILFFTLFVAALGFAVAMFFLLPPGIEPPTQLDWVELLLGLVGGVLLLYLIVRNFRKIFSWRTIKRRFFILVCLVTLIALAVTEENWRGKRAWENHKREWEAKGEKFIVREIAPPPVPDEQNFALTPLLKTALDFVHTTNGIQWRDTNAYAHLQNFRADLSPSRDTADKLALGVFDQGTLANLEACRNFYRGNTNYPQPTKLGTPAEDILVALGKFDTELNELRKAAATRPLSRFPIEYDSEPAAEILLPHLAQIKGIAIVVNLRTIALLDAGKSEEAFQDLKLGFRLSDSIKDEPILIDHLVRIATLSFDLQAIREGLARHAWSDAQLIELEKYLQSLDLLEELKEAIRGERALCIDSLDYLRRIGSVNLDFWTGGSVPSRKGLSFLLSSFFYRNMLTISEWHQQFTFPTIDEKQHRIFPEFAGHLDQELAKLHGFHPYTILALQLFPSVSGAVAKSARLQTYVDAARVACALERYRLANGQFPETLDVLASHLIGSVPNDVMDGQPLRYLRTANGYILYSIGWNKTDDGGKLAWNNGKTPTVNSKSGDWVWSCPVKPEVR